MIDVKKLEKRWVKYKFKSYLLHLIIIVGVIVLILIAIILSDIFIEKQPIEILEEKIEKSVPKKIVEIKKKTKEIEDNQTSQKKIVPLQRLIVEPSYSFISKLESDLNTIEKVEKKYEKIYKVPQVEPVKEIIKEEPIVIPKRRETPIKIIRQNTRNDIKEVIQRFEKNHNPALSLFIARQYYEIKEYKKAYNYALITNGINNDIEDSWIIFAKSLVKLKEKKIAIKMLRKYINYSNSYRATTLLDDINSGQFR